MIHEVTTNKIKLVCGPNESLPVVATLRYDPADPFAVSMVFLCGGNTVEWLFSRELLTAGLLSHVGICDVKCWPSSELDGTAGMLYIELNSPEGTALLEMDADVVSSFLTFTYRMVQAGTESIDMDDCIAMILGESF